MVFYGFDTFHSKALFFASYYDLLVDISEGFGTWILVLVLITTSFTLSTSVQQINAPTILSIRRVTASTVQNKSSNIIAYKSFLKYLPQNN